MSSKRRLGGGRMALLALRYLLAAFFLSAAVNKWKQEYISSDRLARIFAERLEEIDPETFGAWFIEHIGLPQYVPLAWMVCWGETFIGLGLLFGFMTRGAAAGAMLMMFSFAVGGYYDASLIALGFMFLPFVVLPTGQWHGLDARMHARYPGSWLFR
ncbi:MAG: DoxX family protein [Gammaproteobacteria bacterium]|nr:DoxX family protein [Gammaproteobacteria bacterium]